MQITPQEAQQRLNWIWQNDDAPSAQWLEAIASLERDLSLPHGFICAERFPSMNLRGGSITLQEVLDARETPEA